MSKNGQAKQKKRSFKLGYESEDAANVVEKLNLLLANYEVHYQKLRNFHWNVVGPDFFDIHEKLEEQYNFTKEAIDVIAERIRIFGKRPFSTFKEFLDNSEIQEVPADFKSSEMITEVLNDFEILLTHLTETYDEAAEIGDIGTTHMVEEFMQNVEIKYWMFASFNKSEA
ncbi:MAG: DNA starvation/stationary phase protection protein [Flavobacteriales bacterium]|nr:DNA starvation/stationary phase protection protein [Flavobacteriales bacterium]